MLRLVPQGVAISIFVINPWPVVELSKDRSHVSA